MPQCWYQEVYCILLHIKQIFNQINNNKNCYTDLLTSYFVHKFINNNLTYNVFMHTYLKHLVINLLVLDINRHTQKFIYFYKNTVL